MSLDLLSRAPVGASRPQLRGRLGHRLTWSRCLGQLLGGLALAIGLLLALSCRFLLAVRGLPALQDRLLHAMGLLS